MSDFHYASSVYSTVILVYCTRHRQLLNEDASHRLRCLPFALGPRFWRAAFSLCSLSVAPFLRSDTIRKPDGTLRDRVACLIAIQRPGFAVVIGPPESGPTARRAASPIGLRRQHSTPI